MQVLLVGCLLRVKVDMKMVVLETAEPVEDWVVYNTLE